MYACIYALPLSNTLFENSEFKNCYLPFRYTQLNTTVNDTISYFKMVEGCNINSESAYSPFSALPLLTWLRNKCKIKKQKTKQKHNLWFCVDLQHCKLYICL